MRSTPWHRAPLPGGRSRRHRVPLCLPSTSAHSGSQQPPAIHAFSFIPESSQEALARSKKEQMPASNKDAAGKISKAVAPKCFPRGPRPCSPRQDSSRVHTEPGRFRRPGTLGGDPPSKRDTHGHCMSHTTDVGYLAIHPTSSKP